MRGTPWPRHRALRCRVENDSIFRPQVEGCASHPPTDGIDNLMKMKNSQKFRAQTGKIDIIQPFSGEA